MNPGQIVLIGYVARRTLRKPPFLESPTVQEVGCVVDHLRSQHWYHQNRHNALRHFDSEEIAWTALRDDIYLRLERDYSQDPPWRVDLERRPVHDFDLYAYKVFPSRFAAGKEEGLALPELHVVPIPGDYERLGYDAVGWNKWSPFQCSPLICNCEAASSAVNNFCLFDAAPAAISLALLYSAGDWQPVWPGSGHCTDERFCVVEVWRKAKPFREPPRSGPKFEWPAETLRRFVEHTIAHGKVFER